MEATPTVMTDATRPPSSALWEVLWLFTQIRRRPLIVSEPLLMTGILPKKVTLSADRHFAT